jgi:hypothetical protein
MTQSIHPAASPHLPSFIVGPGETDVLMIGLAVFLVVAVLGFGILFFTLHTLPERIAHKSHKLQFEIVAVLGLIALFTHMHIFWVIGLLLALIDFPDLGGWLGKISTSVEKIADRPELSPNRAQTVAEPVLSLRPEQGISKPPPEHPTEFKRGESAPKPQRSSAATGT